ncbi:hypothetical protein Z517_09187 [Fonsecaea pedrosoi CBS 271.37]|uniref:F-box domain-containing protein n=1 Tax=Fonsecaea pedrosoi CBS 271.37 TaxID=1442368 RepID=A0A0D2G7U8_9EURO|nr:uncharacterized protein Z517_09187 [Fonsecaea pedrosoi CBS 271.37]KIW76743.1 hypothetical protein Z517_09187 [Fonsecaea pedrosoi CBS 271.37]
MESRIERPLNLLKLPTEILSDIIDLLDSDIFPANRQHVRKVRQTCKALHRLSEPAFFRSLSYADQDQADKLARVLMEHPHRYDLVNRLIVFPARRPNSPDLGNMVCDLPKFGKLKVLHIVGSGSKDWSLFSALNPTLASSAFPELRECTLVGMCDHQVCINPLLKLPKLTTLKISLPFFHDDDDSLPIPHSTPLKHLVLLVARSLTPNALASILRLPRALETLEYEYLHGFRMDIFSSWAMINGMQTDALNHLAVILARHQPRLELLKLYLHRRYYYEAGIDTGVLDLTALTALKELCLSREVVSSSDFFPKLPEALKVLRIEAAYNNLATVALGVCRRSKLETISLPPLVVFQNFLAQTERGLRYARICLEMPLGRRDDMVVKQHWRAATKFFIKYLQVKEVLFVDRDERFERRIQVAKTERKARMLLNVTPYEHWPVARLNRPSGPRYPVDYFRTSEYHTLVQKGLASAWE